ncbi:uncharacterized protein BJ212DRAFT_1361616 [Suillus subaureus]|uniref:Uncharacterized protein n=1 Tax=Suillus subaureus TaxID=48587 RepID=A0A9P7E978_9AGAM|nr:uncharacterized protein BJ212DRAFT_1361616 [Suillus subaureus]KAG1814708.1 hypothetical protein BJ212DRAFT_1361616 [Suillus subaureus]
MIQSFSGRPYRLQGQVSPWPVHRPTSVGQAHVRQVTALMLPMALTPALLWLIEHQSPTSLCFLAPPLYRRFADQDMEDSYTSNGLSRFSSIASICGNDTSVTSAIYSSVGSCVGLVCLPI